MARIRTIKPEFWTSEQVVECSTNARLLFIGLWNFCDDEGRMSCGPKKIKALVFPADDFTIGDIARWLSELCDNRLIIIYTVENTQYLQVTGWHHQKIDKPQKSKLPPQNSGTVHRTFDDAVRGAVDEHSLIGRGGMEGNGKEGKVEERKYSDASRRRQEPPPSSEREKYNFEESNPPDLRKELFGKGLSKLVAITGKTPDSARSLIGRWLKTVQDEAIHVLAAIEDAERNRIADPVAWIGKSLAPRAGPNRKPTLIEAADNLLAKMRSLDEPPPPGIRNGAGENPVRRLSAG